MGSDGGGGGGEGDHGEDGGLMGGIKLIWVKEMGYFSKWVNENYLTTLVKKAIYHYNDFENHLTMNPCLDWK